MPTPVLGARPRVEHARVKTRREKEETAMSSNATKTRNLAELIQQSLAGNVTHVGNAVRSPGLLFPELSHAIVGAAIEVHRHLGPGQLESVYQRALGKELAARAIPARAQVPIVMRYKGDGVGEFVADFIVDDKVLLELKAVDRPHPAHKAQVISYLRATGLRLGLLLNFNAAVMYRGVTRVVI
jgi:GxxExxY protein